MYPYALIFILILLIIYYSEELRLHPVVDETKLIPFSQYRNRVRTGDIIVLHNGGFIGSVIRIYDQSPASHTGVLIVENDDIYICEIDLYSLFSHDLRASNFDEFMKRQKNNYIGIVPTKKEIPLRLRDIEKIKCKFDITLGFYPLPDRIYCTTLVHRLLSRYGVLPWNGACEHKTTPHTYHNDPSIVFLDYGR